MSVIGFIWLVVVVTLFLVFTPIVEIIIGLATLGWPAWLILGVALMLFVPPRYN